MKDLGCCSKPAYEKVFLNATPLTKSESCSAPPVTFLTPMSLLFKSSWSSESTASTTIVVKKSALRWINFEDMAVPASFRSVSLWLFSVVLTAISFTLFTAIVPALLKPLMMV